MDILCDRYIICKHIMEIMEILSGNIYLITKNLLIGLSLLILLCYLIRLQDKILPLFGEESRACSGAPYLYVTTHDTPYNVLKYSRNGCLLSDKVLKGKSHLPLETTELRSVTIGKYKGENGYLYVADASKDSSQVLVYSNCIADGEDKGRRSYVTKVVDVLENPGADHTYGICFDYDGNIYASFQHTDVVLRFTADDFNPLPWPPAIEMLKRDDYFDGTFMQFGRPEEHAKDDQGLRAIISVRTDIWIAQETYNGVVIASVNTGVIIEVVPIYQPIGLFYDENLDLVFIGSKSKRYEGVVYAIDAKSRSVYMEYPHPDITHPTGLSTHDNILFVADQNLNKILTFDIRTGEFIQIIPINIPGSIEQITISSC